MSEMLMVRKPSPEQEALKQAAAEARERLHLALYRIQRKLAEEETPGEDQGEKHPTEHD